MSLADQIVEHLLPLADQIIVLGEDGNIVEQGCWEDLKTKAGYIREVVVKGSNENERSAKSSREIIESKDKTWSLPEKIPNEKLQDFTRKAGDISLYSIHNPFIVKRYVLTSLKAIILALLARGDCCYF